MSSKNKMPEQRGKISFEGQQATKFWVRAFKLEADIERVRAMIAEKKERGSAAVPIVADFRVDEKLVFIFLFVATVDVLGIQNGSGLIFVASPEHEAEVYRVRDKHAHSLLKHLERQRTFDEVIQIPHKKEES